MDVQEHRVDTKMIQTYRTKKTKAQADYDTRGRIYGGSQTHTMVKITGQKVYKPKQYPPWDAHTDLAADDELQLFHVRFAEFKILYWLEVSRVALMPSR
jgi:hypothetical protein